MSDEKTGRFSSLGEFLFFVDRHQRQKLLDPRIKTLTEGIDSGGGVLVPEVCADEILYAVLDQSIVRKRARVFRMTSDTLNIPRLDDVDRSAGYFGGITVTRLTEAADKSSLAADAKLASLRLVAHKSVALTSVSNELMADAPTFAEFIRTAYGEGVAFAEDNDYINGNGVGRPLGVLPSAATIKVTRAGAGAVNAIDLGNMADRLLPSSWDTAVWLVNQSVWAQLLTLNAAAANVTSVVDFATRTILGRPIITTEHCPALGTEGDVILGDFDHGYVIGDRDMTIDSSSLAPTYFTDDRTVWRIVLRGDGSPVLGAAITPKAGGSTVSHFVALSDAVIS